MKKWIKITLIAAAVLAVLIVIAAIAVSPVAKNYIEKHDRELIGRSIRMERLRMNIFTGRLRIEGLRIGGSEDSTTFFRLDSFEMRMRLWPLLGNRVLVKKISFAGPDVKIYQRGNAFSFDDITARFAGDTTAVAATPEKTSKPWEIGIYDISIRNGRVFYKDLALDAEWGMNDLNLHIPGVYFSGEKTDVGAVLNFAEGGASHDVTEGIKNHGIVPQEAYPGFNYGTEKADFHELSLVLKAYLDAVITASGKSSDKALSTAWKRGFDAILDEYFGRMPETFTYEGKEYTPRSFAASLPIDMDDYIDITSFTHHPFYTQFIIEIPDNWMWGTVYNLPLDEMMTVIDNALANGYPVSWGTDVSEKGFSRTKAIGIIPEADLANMDGTEAERWGKLTQKEKDDALYKFDKPGKELRITQEMRQQAFDNYETTDDHGMVIMGTATDQAGNRYFKVQNSWDVRPPYDGFWYFSRPFVEYKTTSIMVNKNALPKETAKRLGLK